MFCKYENAIIEKKNFFRKLKSPTLAQMMVYLERLFLAPAETMSAVE